MVCDSDVFSVSSQMWMELSLLLVILRVLVKVRSDLCLRIKIPSDPWKGRHKMVSEYWTESQVFRCLKWPGLFLCSYLCTVLQVLDFKVPIYLVLWIRSMDRARASFATRERPCHTFYAIKDKLTKYELKHYLHIPSNVVFMCIIQF